MSGGMWWRLSASCCVALCLLGTFGAISPGFAMGKKPDLEGEQQGVFKKVPSVIKKGVGLFTGGGEIVWELENPFRLFQAPEMTFEHRQTFDELSEDEKRTPILSAERALSATRPRGWAEDFLERTCWSRDIGNYNNCTHQKNSFLHPTSHVIWALVNRDDQAADANGGSIVVPMCQWRLTALKGEGNSAGEVLGEYNKPCFQRNNFTIPYPTGAVLEVSNDNLKIKLSETIIIKDIFIVGMGDSFASGEGNPDVPVQFSKERYVAYGTVTAANLKLPLYPTRVGNWREVADTEFMKQKARWLGQSCHRSLYSHQLRASLQLALSNPKRAVTFAGFACAGVEITHGLFLRYKGNEWSEVPPRLSQISAAAEAQCGPYGARMTQYARAFGVDGKLEVLHDLPVLKCVNEKKRKIDLLMVSIGGNDVGFSSLVANVVVKDIGQLRTVGGWMGAILNSQQAQGKISDLKLRYKALRRALHNVLQIPWGQADRILLTAYPNMTFRDKGKRICDNGAMGMTVSPVFSLSSDKAQRAESFANNLNKAMKTVAKSYKWTFVDGHREAFTSHGICARDETLPAPLSENPDLPLWEGDKWVPYNPSEYAPYARRERWFRTPNDAYLTGHLHISGPVIRNLFKFKSLSQLQVLIAGTYSGAFHPTAEGQAVMADALYGEAERVLNKYGQ